MAIVELVSMVTLVNSYLWGEGVIMGHKTNIVADDQSMM